MRNLSITILTLGVLLSFQGFAFASSMVIDGPGFKVEKRQGWFGRSSTGYQDALGNGYQRNNGLFGWHSNKTSVFGTQVVKNPLQTKVLDPQGNPLVTSQRTLFHGKNTYVNGNGIFQSFKNLFNGQPTVNP